MATYKIRVDRLLPSSLSADSLRRVIEFVSFVDDQGRVRVEVRGDTEDGSTHDELQAFSTGIPIDGLKHLSVALDIIAEMFDFTSNAESEPSDDSDAE